MAVAPLSAVPDVPDEDAVKELLDQVGNFLDYVRRESDTHGPWDARLFGNIKESNSKAFSEAYFMLPAGRAFYLEQYVQKKRFLNEAGELVYY